MAPVVFFSAAIPFQGGDHHINEQWPDYWAGLFKCHDYLPIDCVRGKIWGNSDVEWWYAQNALVFASSTVIQTAPALRREYERTNPRQLCMVHPKLHLGLAGRARVLTVPSIGSSFERMTLESK